MLYQVKQVDREGCQAHPESYSFLHFIRFKKFEGYNWWLDDKRDKVVPLVSLKIYI